MARSIGGSVDAYNEFVGSFERNVYSKARRFSELKVVSEELPELGTIEKRPRSYSKEDTHSIAMELSPVKADIE